jgi:hypothetical protein
MNSSTWNWPPFTHRGTPKPAATNHCEGEWFLLSSFKMSCRRKSYVLFHTLTFLWTKAVDHWANIVDITVLWTSLSQPGLPSDLGLRAAAESKSSWITMVRTDRDSQNGHGPTGLRMARTDGPRFKTFSPHFSRAAVI